MRVTEAFGKFLAHMHCPRPHLLLEEFPGFQLKTVISVNPCLWCLNICNTSHCSGFSSIQVHGVTCHSPADMFQASSSKFFSPLQALLCTPAGWPSRRMRRKKSWSSQKSTENFHLLLQSPCYAFPADPASAWAVSQPSPQLGLWGAPVVSCSPVRCVSPVPWPGRGCELHSVPMSCWVSPWPFPWIHRTAQLHVQEGSVCGSRKTTPKHNVSGCEKDGVFKLCLDYSVLCKLWRKKRESLGFPVKEKSPQ